MKITVDAWAWLPMAEMSSESIEWLKNKLTVTQKISKEYKNRSTPAIMQLYCEDKDRGLFGVPREYFFESMTKNHEVEFTATGGHSWPERAPIKPNEDGSLPSWAQHVSEDPSVLTFYDTINDCPVTLKNEQGPAIDATKKQLMARPASGALVQAPTGWGKSVWSLAFIREMKVRTAVLVHRQFLMDQWKKRIAQYLPDCKVGWIVGDKWKNVEDAHIVLVMIETLASWFKNGKARPELADTFGMVLTDEVHRVGAPMWAPSQIMFNAKWRVGVSADPRRSDGLEKAFQYHIGPKAFTGTAIRMTPKIRRVWTDYTFGNTRGNQGMLSKEFVFKHMSKNLKYNQAIVDQIKLALTAGRKIIVYSDTVDHLRLLKCEVENQYKEKPIVLDFYIGGMTEAEREMAEKADVIFATYQMAKDSLDIPSLDTVMLGAPIRNPQQPGGRALRDYPNKKDPVIVDFRADSVPILREYAESRDRTYKRIYNDDYLDKVQEKKAASEREQARTQFNLPVTG